MRTLVQSRSDVLDSHSHGVTSRPAASNAMKLELDGVCENGALNNQHTKPPLKRPVLFRFILRLFSYGPRFAGMLTRGSMLTRDRSCYKGGFKIHLTR